MKKIIAIYWALFYITNIGFSNELVQWDTLETNTVLYKVTHSDFQNVSYLFGTHHAFGKPFFDSLKFAEAALMSADLLIKENVNIPGHLAVDIINRRKTKVTKWKKYLNEEEYQFVLNLFASSNLKFDKMTPAELFAFLSRHYKEQICIGKNANANYFSLDDYIGSLAQANQIKVIGLETTEEQLALINGDVKGMPRKVHKKRLSRMIARIKSRSKDLCTEIDWYKKMDFDFKFNQPCQNAMILTNRNKRWMVDIHNNFRSKNCFVVVGLSHLMFECGLINHLTMLGYIIEPIKVK
jgi:uncharacterized protein YbaP (TraB family)